MELAITNIFFKRKAKGSKAAKQQNLTQAEVNVLMSSRDQHGRQEYERVPVHVGLL